MAGIGFDLRRVFFEDKGFPKVSTAATSAFTSSGPWIFSIFTLSAIKFFIEPKMAKEEFDALISLIIYSFIFSMIISSPIANMVTRHLSDVLYEKHFDELVSIFLIAVLITGIPSTLLCISFIYFFTSLKAHLYEILVLFNGLSFLWIAMTFVSAMRDGKSVTYMFLAGMCVSFFGLYFYGYESLGSAIFSFAIGVVLSLFGLYARLVVEFRGEFKFDISWLFTKSKTIYSVLLSSLLFYGFMWVDKLIYWFYSDKSVMIVEGFFFFPQYDFAIFVAYLMIIPMSAYFMVFVETVFFESLREYLDAIEKHNDIWVIEAKAHSLLLTFFKCIINLAIFGVLIGFAFFMLATLFLSHFGINIESIPLLRICIMSALLLNLLQAVIIFLYYFDYQKEVIYITGFTFILSLLFSLLFKDATFELSGYAHFISLFFGLIVALVTAIIKIKRVTYYTFMQNELL